MEFQYTRMQGHKFTYQVTLNLLCNAETGGMSYWAWVRRNDVNVGLTQRGHLQATDVASALQEARERVTRNIEDLTGVIE